MNLIIVSNHSVSLPIIPVTFLFLSFFQQVNGATFRVHVKKSTPSSINVGGSFPSINSSAMRQPSTDHHHHQQPIQFTVSVHWLSLSFFLQEKVLPFNSFRVHFFLPSTDTSLSLSLLITNVGVHTKLMTSMIEFLFTAFLLILTLDRYDSLLSSLSLSLSFSIFTHSNSFINFSTTKIGFLTRIFFVPFPDSIKMNETECFLQSIPFFLLLPTYWSFSLSLFHSFSLSPSLSLYLFSTLPASDSSLKLNFLFCSKKQTKCSSSASQQDYPPLLFDPSAAHPSHHHLSSFLTSSPPTSLLRGNRKKIQLNHSSSFPLLVSLISLFYSFLIHFLVLLFLGTFPCSILSWYISFFYSFLIHFSILVVLKGLPEISSSTVAPNGTTFYMDK